MNEHRLFPTNCCVIDISYLRHPTHQTVRVLPKDTWSLIQKQVDLMKSLQRDENGNEYFTDMEISKLERIFDWLNSDINERELKRNRKDFGIFFKEHDKRRGTSFLEVFPKLEKLYNLG